MERRIVSAAPCPTCGGAVVLWVTDDVTEKYCVGDRDDGAGCGWL